MKANPRCDHKDGDRRCPDSAGYRLRRFSPFAAIQLLPGRFCARHAKPAIDRISLDRLQPEHR